MPVLGIIICKFPIVKRSWLLLIAGSWAISPGCRVWQRAVVASRLFPLCLKTSVHRPPPDTKFKQTAEVCPTQLPPEIKVRARSLRVRSLVAIRLHGSSNALRTL